jgi:uncharacterized protein YgfB (UPF0149 family)
MTSISLPTYKELAKALNNTALGLHPSQAHGLICGLLCGKTNSTDAWENLVTGGKETAKAHAILQSLYDASAKQLQEFVFELQLMLPSDKDDLPQRAEALTLWCQGALTGLKMANIKIAGREASDVTEAINDLIEIAKMNYEEVVASEEDEEAYTELVEYVRMAFILIYQDLKAEADSSAKNTSSNLH